MRNNRRECAHARIVLHPWMRRPRATRRGLTTGLCALGALLSIPGGARAQPFGEAARTHIGAVGATAAAPEPVLGEAVPIHDPGGHALDRLHRALRRAERGRGTARLLFYGASHTSSDQYTGYLRRRLQERFGDGGHGFVLPVRPFSYYGQRDVRITQGGPWRTLRVRGRDAPKDAYGLAGFAVETTGRAWGSVEPLRARGRGSRVRRFEVYYLRQPGGGHLELRVDGARVRRLSTRGRRAPAYERLELEEGFHRFEVRTAGDGPVRIFGVVMERAAPGVVVEPLGVPGARVRDQLPWDEAVQREHLRRRDPDLVVLAYGTNESGNLRIHLEAYEHHLRTVVGRIRSAVPRASCLLVGPSEWPVEDGEGGWAPRPTTAPIIELQRRVAAELGCGFFDLVAFLGGPGSMHRWVTHTPPMALEDHVHYTEAGHRRLAEVLEAALLRGYRGR